MNNLGADAYADHLYCKTINISLPTPNVDLTCRDLTATRDVSVGDDLSVIGTSTFAGDVEINTNLNIVNVNNSYYRLKNGTLGVTPEVLQLVHSNGKYMFYVENTGDWFFADAGYGSLTCFGQIITPESFYGAQYSSSLIYGTQASPISFDAVSPVSAMHYNGSLTNTAMLSTQGRATIYGIGGAINSPYIQMRFIYNTSVATYTNANSIPQVRFSLISSAFSTFNIDQLSTTLNSTLGSIDTAYTFADYNGIITPLPVGQLFVIDIEMKLIAV